MASYGQTSILRGIERSNIDSLRRLMSALMRREAGASEGTSAMVSDLTASEQVVFVRVFNTATGTSDSLLRNMTRRFASACLADDPTILRAADDFDRLAVQVVQDAQTGTPEQLEQARQNFRQLVQAGELIYHRGVNEPDTASMVDRSDDDDEMEDEKVTPARMAGEKRKRAQRLISETVSVKEEDEDEEEHAEGAKKAKTECTNWPGPLFKRNPNKPKNAPLRPQGTRCINDGSHDRTPAKVGHRDDSKLSMMFRLEKKGSGGQWVPGGRVLFEYEQEVDWEDNKSVSKLNGWRHGNYIRQLGRKNEEWNRKPWLASERDRLLDILSNHLATRNGRWRLISWDEVADAFNAGFEGTVQKVGAMTASRVKTKDGKPSFGQPLKKNRTAPHRSESALRNQIELFNDRRAQKLVSDAKEADRLAGDVQESEQDSEEEGAEDKSKAKRKTDSLINTVKGKAKEIENSEDEFEKEAEEEPDEAAEDEIPVDDEILDAEFEMQMQEALEKSRKDKARKNRDDRDDGPSSSLAGRSSSAV